MTYVRMITKIEILRKSLFNLRGSLKKTAYLIFALIILSSCHTAKNIHKESASHHPEQIHDGKKHYGKIIEEANTWIGTPYKYAHQEKGRGTDCSGFVMVVYETTTGEKLPRNSAKQAEYCKKIEEEEVEEGDLVFFATGKNPNKVSHVGIVIDKESFIHASSSKGVVVSYLTSNYYRRTFRMFGRVPRRKELFSDN